MDRILWPLSQVFLFFVKCIVLLWFLLLMVLLMGNGRKRGALIETSAKFI